MIKTCSYYRIKRLTVRFWKVIFKYTRRTDQYKNRYVNSVHEVKIAFAFGVKYLSHLDSSPTRVREGHNRSSTHEGPGSAFRAVGLAAESIQQE